MNFCIKLKQACFILGCVIAIPAWGQQDSIAEKITSTEIQNIGLRRDTGAIDAPYDMYDLAKKPEFPGGESGMVKFLAENMKYPPLARENGIQGTVVVSFIIDDSGTVRNPVILKDIGGGCGKEALRVVGTMPKWTPGMANGKPVSVKYTLPLRFKFTNSDKPGVADDSPWPITSTWHNLPLNFTPAQITRENLPGFSPRGRTSTCILKVWG
ncbi:MAG: energy transducer TonB [Saprospiraceae bacterium]|nr:energy transducer TonB [Saprospiraceae bacterium]